ncbi:MAG: ArsR/SmtB family transcription factor [Vicinamibacterales bacterium]
MSRVAVGARGTSVEELEQVFKALADVTRLRILALLGGNEVCVCHIHDSLGLPQPTVSRHLAYLRRAGLVDTRRDGVWMHYELSASLDPSARSVVNAAIEALTGTRDAVQDRKQFERSFGGLYVLAASNGGSCCAPRA